MARTLETYNQKRDFRKTAEPAGHRESSAGQPPDGRLRFVVQHHAASRDHYDFRLEWDGVLLSWAVPKGPSYDPHDKRLAVAVEDHPLEYREFEGTIAEDEYGGGTVMLWDEGHWEPQPDCDVVTGLEGGSLKFSLDGKRLHGRWALVQMKGRASGDGDNWLLIKERDEFAQDQAGIGNFTTSVRTDRTMAQIASRTSIDLAGVRLTSPDREAITCEGTGPGITKEAVARYYLAVAERMLPHLAGRLLHFLRCPGGAPGQCFFQRHLERTAPGIAKLAVREKDGSMDDYFYIENADGLVSAVQMGTLEFHGWGSRIEQLEKPDQMVFDFDPDAGLDLECVRQGVRDIRTLLGERQIKAFLKTSGGKGYHVVIPLEPSAGWDAIQTYARELAEAMVQRWPDRYTSDNRKGRRAGKTYIDWLRNSRSASSVAPYSLRARAGGPVSMPIRWDELDTVAPDGIGIDEALQRIKGKDPWAGFDRARQKLDT